MSVGIPTIGKKSEAPPVPRVEPVAPGADWRDALVEQANKAVSSFRARDRTRNPMVPDNFLDVSNAGFPADIKVLAVQIPRLGVPAEMAQYRDMLNLQWLHMPWNAISMNGGEDGKASVPGAQRIDLGDGQYVAAIANNYLMFSNRKQYDDRRLANTRRSGESLKYKIESRTEEGEEGGKRRNLRVDSTNTGPMTLDQLLAYEQEIGEEPSIKGSRIE